MLDIHPPEHTPRTWRDFFIHIATICLGLVIAIGLEQAVEYLHRVHERRELEQDLHTEAVTNQKVIARDLKMRDLEDWFSQAVEAVDAASPTQGKLHLLLPVSPCIPGSVGTAEVRYFAPSQAVWTTAKNNSLTALLPVEQSRMFARLEHNYVLLAADRDHVFDGCSAIDSMQQRFAVSVPNAKVLRWTMTVPQAEMLAQTAARVRTGIQGLCFRLRWSDVYEQGIAEGESSADIKMMNVNQERFEDNPRNGPAR